MLEGRWQDAKPGLILKDPGVLRAACVELLLPSPIFGPFGTACCLPVMLYDCGPNPALTSCQINPHVQLYQTGQVTATLLLGEGVLSLEEWELALGVSLHCVICKIVFSPFFLLLKRSPCS